MTKTRQNIKNMVSSLQILDLENKSVAAMGLNPTFVWAKLILTDDQPNGNKERIPQEEFSNLIRSGLFTPIKVRAGEIGEGHAEASPIGVITHLKEQSKGNVNQVVGLAALWSEEKPEDVQMIAQRYRDKLPLDVSWEISYKEAEETEAGIKDIRGAILTGTTLVSIPAYGGRTFIEQLYASIKDGDNNHELEEDELEALETLKELKANLEEKNEALASQVQTLETQISERDEAIEALKNSQLTEEVTSELESLREYKAGVEAALEQEEKKEALRTLFSEAGLEVEDDYFEENEKMLMKMEEDELQFFISTLKQAQEASKSSEASLKIPRLSLRDDGTEGLSASDIGKLLHKSRYSKE